MRISKRNEGRLVSVFKTQSHVSVTFDANKFFASISDFYFSETSQQRLDAMQEEVMQVQLKYQRELERLERENKELRKQMLLRGNQKLNNRKIKVAYSITRDRTFLS